MSEFIVNKVNRINNAGQQYTVMPTVCRLIAYTNVSLWLGHLSLGVPQR